MLLHIMDKKGHISEDYISLYEIRMDKDIHDGKDVLRGATIKQESFQ